jgi:ELWxxDGT repeat protein
MQKNSFWKFALAFLATGAMVPMSGVNARIAPEKGGVFWQSTNPSAPEFNSPRGMTVWHNPTSGAMNQSSPAPVTGPSNPMVGFGKFGSAGYKYIYKYASSGGRLLGVPVDKPWEYPVQIGNAGLDAGGFYLVGMADFDGDGVADAVFRSSTTGTNVVWHLNSDGTLKSAKQITSVTDLNFVMVGVGNLNGSGAPDVFFHNSATGQLVAWNLIDVGATYGFTTGSGVIGTYAPGSFAFKDAGDFDGDGDVDFLVRNLPGMDAQIIKTQGGAISGASVSLARPPTAGVGFNPVDFTPEIMVPVPANTSVPLQNGGSNTSIAKDLGTITSATNLSVVSEVGAGQGQYIDSYYKFTTTTANTQIAINLGTTQVYGFGVTPSSSGSAGWGAVGSSVRTDPAYNVTSGVFTLATPGTYYYRVTSRVGSSQGSGMLAFNFSISGVGTPTQVTNLDPGDKSSDVSQGVKMGGFTYFIARSGDAGLWRTDGTAAGTTKVSAISGGNGELVVSGSTLYFAGLNAAGGSGIWKSDGTAAGTVEVKQVNAAGQGSESQLLTFNGKVYFSADDGVNGSELWRTDGTASGTVMAANINATAGKGSDPDSLAVYNGHLVFAATNGASRQLWRLSTADVATPVTNFVGNANLQELTVAGAYLYASAVIGGQDANGLDVNTELIRVDTAWSVVGFDVLAGTGSSSPSSLFAWGGDLYFSAMNTQGRELHKVTNGGASAMQVADIFTGVTGAVQNSSSPTGFASIGGRLVFGADDGVNGRELWAYNGSSAPTRISQIAAGAASSSPTGTTVVNGAAFFTAAATTGNFELYKTTDGINVSLVSEVNTGFANADPSMPFGFVDAGNGKTLFTAFTNGLGFEPMVTDGTAAGTVQLKNINTDPNGGIGTGVTMGGFTYFAAYGKDTGNELYQTDLATNVTTLVGEVIPGVGGSNPTNLVVSGSTVYFSATDAANVTKLWKTTGGAPTIATNVNAAGVSDGIGNLVGTTNGNVYFTAYTPTGVSFRLLNGGASTEIKNFGTTGVILESQALGNDVWVSAKDSGANGIEAWKLNASGAVAIGDVNPGAKSSSPYEFVQTTDGKTFFGAYTDTGGYELYMVPAGSSTPQLVKEIGPGAAGSNLTKLMAMGTYVYFVAYDSAKLRVWRSDGTNVGTVYSCCSNNATVLPTVTGDTSGGANKTTPFSTETSAVLGKESLNYVSYLDMVAIDSPFGKSIYLPSEFALKQYAGPFDPAAIAPQGGLLCRLDTAYMGNNPGREVLTVFDPASTPHFVAADVPFAYPGGGTTLFGTTDPLLNVANMLSSEYGQGCKGNNGFVQNNFYSPLPDSRVSQFEDVLLGTANNKLYIAGWKPGATSYEVWSMAHAESFTKRLNGFGMPTPRNLKLEGTFAVKRGSLEFQPAGASMLVKGYDATTKTNKQWKLQ